jgi:hypothetical protein
MIRFLWKHIVTDMPDGLTYYEPCCRIAKNVVSTEFLGGLWERAGKRRPTTTTKKIDTQATPFALPTY